LHLPPDCLLTAILRDDDVILPSGETVIQAGDQVIALAYRDREAALSGGSSRVDLQACKLGTGRRFTTS